MTDRCKSPAKASKLSSPVSRATARMSPLHCAGRTDCAAPRSPPACWLRNHPSGRSAEAAPIDTGLTARCSSIQCRSPDRPPVSNRLAETSVQESLRLYQEGLAAAAPTGTGPTAHCSSSKRQMLGRTPSSNPLAAPAAYSHSDLAAAGTEPRAFSCAGNRPTHATMLRPLIEGSTPPSSQRNKRASALPCE